MKLNFKERVLAIVRKIPKGSVMTYGHVAARAGSPGAARAVGTIMANNFDPSVPCHRVIKSDGSVGQYNRGGSRVKTKLLIAEGALKKSH
jgi:O-6-methylguanine DNA methyltransferase